eukprot:CAMPEP_0113846664 /NCGR_PEP_ID=MMETSP0372-20130328/1434_1 /TAXON_ID=340204 /ORGANISM="Lankesteria abbotti" /LENGTH=231 /DNA_ID=CAMNT_0000815835 /DNA_START=18 /DNA_END=713 /DNA_ORIENTATION=- /assembly_acc=CAM_ASM_000359
MKYFFGGTKKTAKDEENNNVTKVDLPAAIMKNKEAINTLEKRQTHLEKRANDLTEEAKQRIGRKDTQGAKLALKRKQMLDNELAQLGNARLTLEQQINTLESQQTQQMAIRALSQGVEAQKQLNSSLNINSIDKLMDDLQEQQDRQQEVASVLSQNIPMMDEDDIMAELGRLEEEDIEQKLAGLGSVPTSLVGVSSSPVVTTTTVEAPCSKPDATVLSDQEQLRLLEADLL